jgi:hypothetical protein
MHIAILNRYLCTQYSNNMVVEPEVYIHFENKCLSHSENLGFFFLL